MFIFLRCKVSNYLSNRKAKTKDFANKGLFFVQKLLNEAKKCVTAAPVSLHGAKWRGESKAAVTTAVSRLSSTGQCACGRGPRSPRELSRAG